MQHRSLTLLFIDGVSNVQGVLQFFSSRPAMGAHHLLPVCHEGAQTLLTDIHYQFLAPWPWPSTFWTQNQSLTRRRPQNRQMHLLDYSATTTTATRPTTIVFFRLTCLFSWDHSSLGRVARRCSEEQPLGIAGTRFLQAGCLPVGEPTVSRHWRDKLHFST